MMPTNTPSIDLPHKAYILPENVSMWPPVWWTWLVVAALIFALMALLFLQAKKHQKKRYRREALQALSKSADELDDKNFITCCHELIRRCLISENKLALAALPSHSLIKHLDQSLSPKHQFEPLGDIFISGPYRPDINLTAEQKKQMLDLTRYWIRKHRV